jgi:hypothetical protein
MKPIYYFLVILLITGSSCSRSTFSTTLRHTRQGRVYYSNHNLLVKNHYRVHKVHLLEQVIDSSRSQAELTNKMDINPSEKEIERINTVKMTDDISFPGSAFSTKMGFLDKMPYGKWKSNMKRKTRETGSVEENTVKPDKITRLGSGEAPLYKQYYGPKMDPMGVWGFILSIFGFLPFIGILMALLGIILGAVSLHRINCDPGSYRGRGFAIAAIVTGILALVFNIWLFVWVLTEGLFMNIGSFSVI